MHLKTSIKLLLAVILIVFANTIFLLFLYQPRFQRLSTKIKQILQKEQVYNDDVTGQEDLDYDEDEEIRELLYEEVPNIAPYYYNNSIRRPQELNDTCAKFPQLYNLKINNIYWQSLKSTNGSFQLYSAYLDTRPKDFTVRIIAMIDVLEPNVTLHCHLWISGVDVPVVVPVSEIRLVWNKAFTMQTINNYYTHLISCIVPQKYSNSTIISTSLVEKYCDNAKNNLKVWHDKGKRQGFAVCVKGLNYPRQDISVRLIEWIELLLLLGVDQIHFYNLQSHKGTLETLRYYQERGSVTLTELTLPESHPNLPKLQHYFLKNNANARVHDELVPYNDCFYKHMYQHEYIALLDIDEVIIPREDNNWPDMVNTQKARATLKNQNNIVNFVAQNVYFLDMFKHEHEWYSDIPHEYHMLQHVQRTGNFSPTASFVKTLFDTSQVLTLHNHSPFSCLKECKLFFMPNEEVQLSHYRGDCHSTKYQSCEDLKKDVVEDKVIWKWKEELIRRVDMTVIELENRRAARIT